MSRQFCKVETDGHLLIVTLDRPDQLNALPKAAHHELGAVFDAFEADPELWVGIVTGAGRAFCAGVDLKQADGAFGPDYAPATGFGGLTHRFDRTKPLIAAVNGPALGGGFEIALACDVIVAAESASFGLTEPRLGLAALAGGVQRLMQDIGPKRANSMLLTGRRVPAREAAELGFVNEVVPDGELMAAAWRWADAILSCSPSAIRATKGMANETIRQNVRTSMEQMLSLPEVRAIGASPDAVEGPRAFAEHRPPIWSNPAD